MNQYPTPSMSQLSSIQKNCKIMIADDHNIFRHGLKMLLEKFPFVNITGEADNGRELRKLMEFSPPDVIFLDLNMPHENGIEATISILKAFPNTMIVVLSQYDDAITVERMMKLGAMAYLTKSITPKILDQLFEHILQGKPYISPDAATHVAIKKVAVGFKEGTMPEQSLWLKEEITPREQQVLQMLVKGMTQKEVAAQLNLSPRTIETHKEKLMRRLGVKNMSELISVAHEYKLI